MGKRLGPTCGSCFVMVPIILSQNSQSFCTSKRLGTHALKRHLGPCSIRRTGLVQGYTEAYGLADGKQGCGGGVADDRVSL